MLANLSLRRMRQQGATLLEVLVTIIVLAVGLLGLAGLQSKLTLVEMESYQRSQALTLMNDMVDRINTNRSDAANYVSTITFGTADTSQPTACGSVSSFAGRDQCEWSKILQGAAETKSGSKIGAMDGARGCITQIQAQNPAAGVCTPGIYRVALAWQGLHTTSAPAVTCGQGSFGSDDRYRRVLSTNITIGLPSCE